MLYNTFKRNTIYIENSELKELNEIAELSNEAISLCLVDELDTNMEFRIFDDRGKVDVYVNMDKILWEDDEFVLCESFDKRYCDVPILIRKSTREVMNTDFYSWLAETY